MTDYSRKSTCCSDQACSSGKAAQTSTFSYDVQNKSVDGFLQTYKIDGMDCGSCAKTLEKRLQMHPAVKEVQVQFALGKMQIMHEAHTDTIIHEVSKAGFKATLMGGHLQESVGGKDHRDTKDQKELASTAISGGLLLGGVIGLYAGVTEALITIILAVVLLLAGYKPARSAFFAVKSGSLDMNVLMTVAAIGAAILGEWVEGATVVWLFSLGNLLQSRTLERTRESIRSLMKLTPLEASVRRGERIERIPVEAVGIGEIVLIKPGDKIPVDGQILKGQSSIDQSSITGESLPVDKEAGDPVYAGTINQNGLLEVTVTKDSENTTIANIIRLVEEAQEKKAPTQTFVERFAAIYTPVVFTLALLVMVIPPLLLGESWSGWFYKGLELLVIACPCALVISTPVAIVSAIGHAAKNGVLIKGGSILEAAGMLDVVAFDKTGTLTEGKPKVTNVIVLNGSEDDFISIARSIEEHANHPIARAIIQYAQERNIKAKVGDSYQTIPGKGAQVKLGEIVYYAGNPRWFIEMGVPLDSLTEHLEVLQQQGSSTVLVGTTTEIIGLIAVADSVRETAVETIKKLRQSGVSTLVMLTGDHPRTAEKIAAVAGIDRFFAELLPQKKAEAITKMQQERKIVAMVGDGINDAPALAVADVGIAMGGAGTDTAMETADIVLMADNLEKLPYTMKLSKKARVIIRQNIWFSITVKLIAFLLIFPGWLTLWMAVISDTGAALLVILNSMRLLWHKN